MEGEGERKGRGRWGGKIGVRKNFCVIFSNIFSLGNPQYFYCISKSLGWQRLCHPGSLGWQSLCNPWDEMFATFNEEIYETCGAEMLV